MDSNKHMKTFSDADVGNHALLGTENESKRSVSGELLKSVLNNFSDKITPPLFVLRSYAQLLQRAPSKDVLDRGLMQLDIASSRLNLIVNSLYDLLEIYCQEKPDNELVFFQEVFELTKVDLFDAFDSSRIKLEIDFNNCSKVWFPISYLKEIFKQLLSNALSHNNEQEDLVISISSYKLLNSTVIEIKDNGVGIDLSSLKGNLGKPFNKHSNNDAHVGIGLSIVKAIADVTNSVYEIESSLGEGTICRFYFRQ